MSDIKRYIPVIAQSAAGPFAAMDSTVDGCWVEFEDHESEIARLRAEADALRKVVGEVTQCLADTVNEVGGWAVEEVIEAGMAAAMGADA